MTPGLRPLIIGNWKMNGVMASLEEARALADSLRRQPSAAEVGVCPPATLIAAAAAAVAGSPLLIGGQDCHAEPSGAYTGEISAPMLVDAGAALVILGHSERRRYQGETDAGVSAKVRAASSAGLRPIVCCGENLDQHRAGRTLEVVEAQLAGSLPTEIDPVGFAVAYEPYWAVGTGQTPATAQIARVHAAIRTILRQRLGETGARAPILYGGSVKAENAGEILHAPGVDGALVGGASLLARDFLPIVRAI